jgi:hypothetical protein
MAAAIAAQCTSASTTDDMRTATHVAVAASRFSRPQLVLM